MMHVPSLEEVEILFSSFLQNMFFLQESCKIMQTLQDDELEIGNTSQL